MYIRQVTRKNKDGSGVTYVQLAHNQRKGANGAPVAEILYNFGRSEDVDVVGLQRLVRSIERFLGTGAGSQPDEKTDKEGRLRLIESRRMGGAFLLRELWKKLGIDRALGALARSQQLKVDPVPALFAMVANRALEPSSKHAIPEWARRDVALPDVGEVTDDRLYRAMDFLIQAEDEVQRAVFFATSDLLSLEVDLLLYDTTSSYFEMEDDDVARADRQRAWDAFDRGGGPEPLSPRPQVVNDPPLRMKGHSKDKRPDLAQVVIGMAVTRQGIPVRCWTWPGNTADAATVAKVKADLRGWKLNRVVWAVDRGFVSEDNLRELQKGGAHYIAGRKLRGGEKDVQEALSRQGRFKRVSDNLEVKEIVVGEGEARPRSPATGNSGSAPSPPSPPSSPRCRPTKMSTPRPSAGSSCTPRSAGTSSGARRASPSWIVRRSRPRSASTASTCFSPATTPSPLAMSPSATSNSPRSNEPGAA